MEQFLIRYDGLQASDHQLDMRLLGRSLVGIEELVQRGLWAGVHPDRDRGRRRLDVSVVVEAPRTGCVEIHGGIIGAMGVLPFMHEVATSLGVDYIKHVITGVLLMNGGRESDAGRHLDKALDIIQENQRLQVEDRRHERQLVAHALSLVANKSAPIAKEIVAPIGPSAEFLTIGDPADDDTTKIDVAIADAIRTKDTLKVGDMETLRIRFDKLVRHNRTAAVEMITEPGSWHPAEIRDPAYDDFPNAYSRAFSDGIDLTVSAKVSRRLDGSVAKIHIFDAG